MKLIVYDVLGKEVMKLVDDVRMAGNHIATFDGSALASGIYIYRLEAAGQTSIKKMVLTK